MFKRILLATDFSPHAEVAKQVVIHLTRQNERQLWVLTVLEPLEEPLAGLAAPPMASSRTWEAELSDEKQGLEQAQAQRLVRDVAEIEATGIRATQLVREGDPDQEIVAAAKEIGADLIVMGSHSERTFWEVVLGSVTEKVAKQAPCPVMVVSQRPPHPGTVAKHILLATDFSAHAEMAFQAGLSLASEDDQHLWLLTVLEPGEELPMPPGFIVNAPDSAVQELEAELRADVEAKVNQKLNELVARALEAGVQTEKMVHHGHPAREIAKAALDVDADLIVVGSHSRRNLWDTLLGNTAEKLSQYAVCPVLIVTNPMQKQNAKE